MSVKNNLLNIKQDIPRSIKLVAVSKTKPNEDILEAYKEGHRDFGENRVAELDKKHNELPKDINWHFIGHLQSKKVKTIAPFVSLIHSVDSFKLLKVIDKEAKKNNRVIDCLLQFHIAKESTKYGLSFDEANDILNSDDYKSLNNVKIIGVMGMGTFTDKMEVVRAEFKNLKAIYQQLKSNFFSNDDDFKEISMGMTNDYKTAIDEGSTILRIGSKIFGSRN